MLTTQALCGRLTSLLRSSIHYAKTEQYHHSTVILFTLMHMNSCSLLCTISWNLFLLTEWINEYDLSDAVREMVAGTLYRNTSLIALHIPVQFFQDHITKLWDDNKLKMILILLLHQCTTYQWDQQWRMSYSRPSQTTCLLRRSRDQTYVHWTETTNSSADELKHTTLIPSYIHNWKKKTYSYLEVYIDRQIDTFIYIAPISRKSH